MNTTTGRGNYRKWIALGVFLAIAFAVSFIGSLVTLPKIPLWYAGLVKPSFNPPAWIFGPVWTLLYAMMSIAAWRVWASFGHPGRNNALGWYFGQLVLNAVWSPVFFGLEQPRLALGVIAALLVAIIFTIARFWPIDRVAAWMLAPYLAWVSFATILNASIVALN